MRISDKYGIGVDFYHFILLVINLLGVHLLSAFSSLGRVADLAAIFLALRGSCGTLAHDISRRGHLIFLLLGPLGVFDLARAAHLAH